MKNALADWLAVCLGLLIRIGLVISWIFFHGVTPSIA